MKPQSKHKQASEKRQSQIKSKGMNSRKGFSQTNASIRRQNSGSNGYRSDSSSLSIITEKPDVRLELMKNIYEKKTEKKKP